MRFCNYYINEECTNYEMEDGEQYEDCDKCPYFTEGDEFVGYMDWIKSEDAKLRYAERMNG